MYRVYAKYWIEDYYECKSGGGKIFTDKSDAEEYCNSLNKDSEFAFELYEDIRNKSDKFYGELFSEISDFELLDIPKWKAGIHMDEITEEMRSERNRIKEENDRRVDKYNVQRCEAHEKVEAYKSELLDKLILDGDIIELIKYYLDNGYLDKDEYGFEEVEFVK